MELERQEAYEKALEDRCVPCLYFKGFAWGQPICDRGKKWPKKGLCKFYKDHPARAARKAGL